jgi:hypothetical protein
MRRWWLFPAEVRRRPSAVSETLAKQCDRAETTLNSTRESQLMPVVLGATATFNRLKIGPLVRHNKAVLEI